MPLPRLAAWGVMRAGFRRKHFAGMSGASNEQAACQSGSVGFRNSAERRVRRCIARAFWAGLEAGLRVAGFREDGCAALSRIARRSFRACLAAFSACLNAVCAAFRFCFAACACLSARAARASVAGCWAWVAGVGLCLFASFLMCLLVLEISAYLRRKWRLTKVRVALRNGSCSPFFADTGQALDW